MLASQLPTLVPVAFASGAGAGFINPIPIPSQIGPTDPGLASMDTGFTPITFQPLVAGGIPPRGQDFNGILNLESSISQWVQAGGAYPYNAGFATAIGGYPNGAVVRRSDYSGSWISTVDNNTVDPDTTAGPNWVPYGQSSALYNVNVSNANITFSALQAASGVIRLNGTLTAPITLTLPNWPGVQWTIINNYTVAGAGTNRILIKVPGSLLPVTLSPVGASQVYSNGTDLINNAWQVGSASDVGQAVALGQFTNSFGTTGWIKRPDGVIEQWGTFVGSAGGFQAINFFIAFPTGCANIVGSVEGNTATPVSFMWNTSSVNGFNGATVSPAGYVAATAAYRAIGH